MHWDLWNTIYVQPAGVGCFTCIQLSLRQILVLENGKSLLVDISLLACSRLRHCHFGDMQILSVSFASGITLNGKTVCVAVVGSFYILSTSIGDGLITCICRLHWRKPFCVMCMRKPTFLTTASLHWRSLRFVMDMLQCVDMIDMCTCVHQRHECVIW